MGDRDLTFSITAMLVVAERSPMRKNLKNTKLQENPRQAFPDLQNRFRPEVGILPGCVMNGITNFPCWSALILCNGKADCSGEGYFVHAGSPKLRDE